MSYSLFFILFCVFVLWSLSLFYLVGSKRLIVTELQFSLVFKFVKFTA